MSPKSRFLGVNLRAPATANTQGGNWVMRVDWTVVFARGKVRIFVCDPRQAAQDMNYPSSLSDSTNLAKFIRHILPGTKDSLCVCSSNCCLI